LASPVADFYTVASGVTVRAGIGASSVASQSWVSRSTAPGVVWSHRFDSDAEVDAFKLNTTSVLVAQPLTRVSDPVVGNALQLRHLGARLTADFLAAGGNGPRAMVVDNADRWPTGDFHFIATQIADTGAAPATLFYCSTRTGNTLTVTYVPLEISAFDSGASFTDRFIGDCVGSASGTWTRPFSAFAGTDNGRGSDDLAASGAVPVRSRQSGDPEYVPQGASLFGYGYYGHPDYHDDARFNPWVPGSQATWMDGDGVSREDPFDGSEFWLQFRMWIDPVYWQEHVLPDPATQNFWGRKVWMLQTETTVPQQLTATIAPTNVFTIPSTNESPFSLAKFTSSGGSASATLTENPYNTSGSSFQPGSGWAATALWATSGLPSTGQATPDGNSAWEYSSGEWLTVLVHMRPGKIWHRRVSLRDDFNSATQTTFTLVDAPDDWPTSSFQVLIAGSTFDVTARSGATCTGVALASGADVNLTAGSGSTAVEKLPATPAGSDALSTYLEVRIAREGEDYQTVMEIDNYPIQYGSNGQYESWFNGALPGFQAIALTGYLNQDLSIFTAPAATYDVRFGELIFSRAFIPAPNSLTYSVPSGAITNISTNTRADVNPRSDADLNPNAPSAAPWEASVGWGASALSAFCGAVMAKDMGVGGKLMTWGAPGHSTNLEFAAWVAFDVASRSWEIIGTPPPTEVVTTYTAGVTPPTTRFDHTWGEWNGGSTDWTEAFRRPGYNPPMGSHTRNSFVYIPAADAGNNTGKLVVAWQPTGNVSGTNIRGSFIYDCDTELFSRTANVRFGHGSAVTGIAYHADQGVVIGHNRDSSVTVSELDVFDTSTNTWTRRNATAAIGLSTDSTNFICGDLFVMVANTVQPPVFRAAPVSTVKAGGSWAWATLTVSAASWPVNGSGNTLTTQWSRCPDNGAWYAVNRQSGSNTLWKLVKPSGVADSDTASLLSGTWTVTTETLTGSGLEGASFDYGRLQWCPALTAFLWFGDLHTSAVQAIRPVGV
jgi:hypothetical protein